MLPAAAQREPNRGKRPDGRIGSPVKEGGKVRSAASVEEQSQSERQTQIEDGIDAQPCDRLDCPIVVAREIIVMRPPERLRNEENDEQDRDGKEARANGGQSKKEGRRCSACCRAKPGIEVTKPQVDGEADD